MVNPMRVGSSLLRCWIACCGTAVCSPTVRRIKADCPCLLQQGGEHTGLPDSCARGLNPVWSMVLSDRSISVTQSSFPAEDNTVQGCAGRARGRGSPMTALP